MNAFTAPWDDIEEAPESTIPTIGQVSTVPAAPVRQEVKPDRDVDYNNIKIGAGNSGQFHFNLSCLQDNYLILVPVDGAREYPSTDAKGNPCTKQKVAVFILNDNPTFYSTKEGKKPLEWNKERLHAGDTLIVETNHKGIKNILTKNYNQKDDPQFLTPLKDGSFPQKELLAGKIEMGKTADNNSVLRLFALDENTPQEIRTNWGKLAKQRIEFLKEYADFL